MDLPNSEELFKLYPGAPILPPGSIGSVSGVPVSGPVPVPPVSSAPAPAAQAGRKTEESHLKDLAAQAADLSLEDLAVKVKQLDGKPNAPVHGVLQALNNAKDIKQEKHHQLFGMVWLQTMCEASPTAVIPRNRIYARYVSSCANSMLRPLTPASFGKLIRILYPNLKTRRLGMRGKSKYHYCGIKLVGPDATDSPASSLGLDSPLSQNTPSFSGSPASGQTTPVNSESVREQLNTNDMRYLPQLFSAIDAAIGPSWISSPFSLPPLQPYLRDADLDPDIVDTLHSLYRVHCMSVFECLRYMHVDRMFSLFPQFSTILTTPVFKLYTSDAASEWVKQCDLAMYRAMLKMLTRLQLQPVPPEILQPLEEIAREYVSRLASVLHAKFPPHFAQLRLRLARQFVSILKRLIKCIETGHKAAEVLASPHERSLMLQDWLRVDLHEVVSREVPCAADNTLALMHVLADSLVHLLEEAHTLPRYATFLFELPAKFPRVSPWLFSLVASNLLTTCLREMSLTGGQSFGSWWVVRCWVDEYILWFLELGGYLHDEFQSEFERSLSVKAENAVPVPDSGRAVDLLHNMHESWLDF